MHFFIFSAGFTNTTSVGFKFSDSPPQSPSTCEKIQLQILAILRLLILKLHLTASAQAFRPSYLDPKVVRVW